MDDAAPDLPPTVADVLVEVYGSLRRVWRDALLVTECSPDAPWNREADGLRRDDLTFAQALFASCCEDAAVLAAQAVTQHLGLLARAYWLDPVEPDGPEHRRWLHAAAFAPARAVMEGTAMTGWLLAPLATSEERVLRGAMLALWSKPKSWTGRAAEAGLTVERTPEANVPFVRVDHFSKPLSLTTMIKEVHGKEAPGTYGRWSKLLHNDPHAIGPDTVFRLDGEGMFGGYRFREDDHLALAATVARMLLAAGERQAAYFGRSADTLIDECEAVVAVVEAQLPAVVEAMQARDHEPRH
ncbi:hypothetical protein IOD16_18480 [Saccharothrix sp. 6-C]|uniref:hypothetical protein n=1 Tax=Saccharothrix sp. 6-C TaxID=2781735 RepID=UPI001916FFE8|nr:hypothetical protein [Saccharothrix sp. 6-C]QQQ80191.1 hypothetical protein IOD16_18480 [Saccharothrix sp. 6-C]